MFCRKRQPKRGRGFSLVEVLVAIAVFGIATSGLVALHKVSMDSVADARERTSASTLGQFAMAWIQNEAGHMAIGGELLNYVLVNESLVQPGTWQLLATGDAGFRFDEYLGHTYEEQYDLVDVAKYCVAYMVAPYQLTDANEVAGTNLLHASVWVTWPKSGQYEPGWDSCMARMNAWDHAFPASNRYHQMMVTKVLTTDFAQKM